MLLPLLALFVYTGCEKSESINLTENTDYFIRGSFTGQYLNVKKRGYYIDTLDQPNAPYYYIICMGEKSSGGYSLKIKEIHKISNKTEIIVEEITPGNNEVVTTALTSPTIVVEFPKYQENIIIKNTNNEEFNKLNDWE